MTEQLMPQQLQGNPNKKTTTHGGEMDVPEFDLTGIIKADEIQSIMDDFYALTKMTTAILDLQGRVIEATGWQDICIKFHRINPRTARNCTESDLFLAKNLKPGKYIDYKCKNGLRDIVTPLYVGTKHLGNIYTGQFFYEDDEIDEGFFIRQAAVGRFDQGAYLEALRKIPRYNRETIDHLMSFLVKFSQYISKIGLLNIQLEKEIHERKKAEKSLQENETHLRVLIRTIPDLVWLKDQKGRFLLCNSRFENLYGEKEKDIIGKTDYDFVDKELADFFRKHDKAAIDRGGPCINEEEVTFADDGHREILETIKAPMYTNEGQLAGVLGIGRDITARKRTEKEREPLIAAIEQSSDIIVITDTEGKILYTNAAFEKSTGYTRKEVIGQNPKILKSGDQDAAFYRDMWETITKGQTWQGRLNNKKKNGSIYTEDATIKPLVDASGTPINFVAVKRDITEQLRIDREKTQLEEQYQQAQKMESIGRLAGGVAHDLNNLLTPILGYGELLLGDFDPSDSRKENVENIIQAGFKARDLVHQLLAFSRKQPLKSQPVDINKTITRFKKLIRRTIRADIDIRTTLSPDLQIVTADIGQIEQVIMNLVVNAADAMSEGGRLTIETAPVSLTKNQMVAHQEVTPGEYVLLTISDTGCGMDAETLAHVFEPFFTTKGEKGTGLGLPTVYGIVQQHGGNVRVYSEPGIGTTFKVFLPVAKGTFIEKGNEEKTAAAYPKGFETLLVVEDNEIVRRLARTILTRQGYRVLMAENGTVALTILSEQGDLVDLLLTDIVMPEMNGKDLFTSAREVNPDLKVLYMSGYTDDVITHDSVQNEDIPFIQKPFSVHDLASKVREVLDNH